MAGLDPAIHVLPEAMDGKTWMPGPDPGMTAWGAKRLAPE